MSENRIRIFLLVIFIVFAGIANLHGQSETAIKRISGQIVFDGKPTEDLWSGLNNFKLTMWRPDFGAEPSEKSDVRIGYDDEFIWIGASFYMKDASKIFVVTKKRDDILWDYDAFGIVIDAYNDNETGLAFFTNPAGLRTDFSVSNDGSFTNGLAAPMNTSWDTFWDVKTTQDDKGWYLEMRIPFSSLKFKTVNGIATMGIILQRSISSNNETDMYPAIDNKYSYSAFIKPSQAAKITFEGAKPTKPIYIAPYVLAGFSRDQVPDETNTKYVKKDKFQYNAGLDVKYNINSNLTLDLTANTDFAQIEADDQQVNLTRFSLFFPEKRKFFQERSSLFDFRLGGMYDNLFYSRNIGLVDGNQIDIYGGARLTGRVGKWDLGFLDMQTASYDTMPGENFGVLRMRRQVINQNSYIGGIFTSRVGMSGAQNYVYGLDGIFKLFGDDYLNVKWAQTYDNRADSKLNSLDPSSLIVNWERRSQKGLGYNFNYTYSGKDFNPGIGFVLRNGVQGASAYFIYGWLPGEKSKWLNYSINLNNTIYTRLSDGGIQSLNVNPYLEFGTKKGLYGQVGLMYQQEGVLNDFNLSKDVKIYAGDYTFTNMQLSLSTTSTTKVSFSSNANIGQFYDGNIAGFTVGPILNLSSSLNINLTYGYNAIRFPERVDNNSLDIHSVNVKALYMFSTKLSASVQVQYMNTQDNLITNFRIRYNPKEGNDCYLVYNDSRGITGVNTDLALPEFYNKTIMFKYVYTFTIK
jgi:hypothetical protein